MNRRQRPVDLGPEAASLSFTAERRVGHGHSVRWGVNFQSMSQVAFAFAVTSALIAQGMTYAMAMGS